MSHEHNGFSKETRMSNRYPFPDIQNLPEDLRAKILEVQEKAGFVPNVFLALARRPAEWRAFFAYHDALMVPESVGRTSNLTKGDREMIVTTTSAANQCLYCVVAHGAILRIYEKKPLVVVTIISRSPLVRLLVRPTLSGTISASW